MGIIMEVFWTTQLSHQENITGWQMCPRKVPGIWGYVKEDILNLHLPLDKVKIINLNVASELIGLHRFEYNAFEESAAHIPLTLTLL